MEATLICGISLSVGLLTAHPNSDGREAARYASLATYRQTGLDKIVEPKLQYLERRYVPETLKQFGVTATFVYRAVVDQKIEYSWSF